MNDIIFFIMLISVIILVIGIVIYFSNKSKLQTQRANLLNNVSGNNVCNTDYKTYYNKYKDTYKEKDCSKFRSNDNKFAVCKKYERCGDFNENNKKCFISLCNLLLRNELSNEEERRDMIDKGIYD